jgi:hypothetical protein
MYAIARSRKLWKYRMAMPASKRKPLTSSELRAAKLSRIPGVTLAEAAERFGVPVARVRAARSSSATPQRLSSAELVLAALTNNGQERSFSRLNLERVAEWLDYVNHDACSVAEVEQLLESLAADGWLELEGETGELLKDWP